MTFLSDIGCRGNDPQGPVTEDPASIAVFKALLRTEPSLQSSPLYAILDLAGDAFVVINEAFQIVLFNRAAERIFQYETADVIGKRVDMLLPERFRAGHDGQMSDFRHQSHGSRLMGERRQIAGVRRDGTEFPAEASIAWVAFTGGGAYVVVLRDITERTRVEQQTARFGRIIEQSINEIFVFNAEDHRFVLVNRQARENLGYSSEELLGMTPADLRFEFTEEEFGELLRPLQDGTMDEISYATVYQRRDGTTYQVEGRLQLLRNETPPVFVAIARDITERSHFETLIRRQSLYDALTLLPNRTLFTERLTLAVEERAQDHGNGGMLLIDLLGFRMVIDSLGRAAGDRVIQEAGRRLAGCLRASDTLARLEGAEFGVLAASLDKPARIGMMADRLMAAFDAPIKVDGVEITLSPALGITCFPNDGLDPEALMRKADAALWSAREEGSSHKCFYTPDLDVVVNTRVAMKSGLGRALERDEFSLVFQPKVDVKSWTVCGCEALLRWRSAELGNVSPADFVPVLEETGLINQVGEWVLENACRQRRALIDRGVMDVRMAINLSVRQIRPTFPATLLDILRRTGLRPSDIELEITETVLMKDSDEVVLVLHELAGMGVHLALDDFGTGYSSLSYIKLMPLHTIKIDRSLITDIATGAEDAEIVRAVIDMGHSMSRRIVAEGVETEQQLAHLRRLGCDEIQGYLFSRPVPGPDLLKLLAGLSSYA
ncbi:histidine kinase [Skermanella stibiiresistens SB22]|uniref:Histidine kinase n=1 Tax=Skermanella stibiiresistens SB22 TaxID=1385369 RepID=W9H568_9PROT|nr:EAL domain-containing protein [Skermanella stibiiresistens]EWY39931.1 histidine kinase [Skermanella stibiiresistens SB22]